MPPQTENRRSWVGVKHSQVSERLRWKGIMPSDHLDTSVGRLRPRTLGRSVPRSFRLRMSAVAHWPTLQIGVHDEKIKDWKQQTSPKKLQSECSHPVETLQSVSTGRAFSIGCRQCHSRWKSMRDARSRFIDARKEHPSRTTSTFGPRSVVAGCKSTPTTSTGQADMENEAVRRDPATIAKQLSMTVRTFQSWVRIMKVVADFAKRLSLLEHVHTSLKAFEEVASLVHKRQVNRQKLLDIEANRRQREKAGQETNTPAVPSYVAGCAASSSTSPKMTASQACDVHMGMPMTSVAESITMSNVAASIKKLIQFANTKEKEEILQHVLGE